VEEGDHLKGISLDGRMNFKYLKETGWERMWTGFVRYRKGMRSKLLGIG
jgi:hypothetical protein